MKELWVPVSAAIAQQRKVETIANNVANANTTGFKKDKLVFKEYLTSLNKVQPNVDLPNKEWSPEDFYRHQGAENAFVKIDGSYTNHTQGQLRPTGNALDLGIQGDGFLEVLTPNGIRYSRKGTLSISTDGNLVNEKGHPVLSKIPQALLESQGSEQGASIPKPQDRTINLGAGGKINISKDGKVFVSGNQVGELSIAEFKDRAALTKEGSSYFINPDNKNLILDNVKSVVHQGFLEGSNVNALAEMSELIKAHRHFESIQKAIKTYDDISGRAISELTRF